MLNNLFYAQVRENYTDVMGNEAVRAFHRHSSAAHVYVLARSGRLREDKVYSAQQQPFFMYQQLYISTESINQSIIYLHSK